MPILVILIVFVSTLFATTASSNSHKELEKYYTYKVRLDALRVKQNELIEQLTHDELAENFQSLLVNSMYWLIAGLKISFNLNSLINAYASYIALYCGLDVAYAYYPNIDHAQRPALWTTIISLPVNLFIGNYLYKQIDITHLGSLSFEHAKEMGYHFAQALYKADRALFCAYAHTVLSIVEPKTFYFPQKLSNSLAYILRMVGDIYNLEPLNIFLFSAQLIIIIQSTYLFSLFVLIKLLSIQPAQAPPCLVYLTWVLGYILAHSGLTLGKTLLQAIQFKIITYLDEYTAGTFNYEQADHYLHQAENYYNRTIQAYNTAYEHSIR